MAVTWRNNRRIQFLMVPPPSTGPTDDPRRKAGDRSPRLTGIGEELSASIHCRCVEIRLAQQLADRPLARRLFVDYILNQMVQYSKVHLDNSFAALSDATRRGVLEQLGRADASITELAEKFHMTLTGMKKHVGVLEQAGLVTTEKVGRVRTCKLGSRRLEEEAAWIESYRQLWTARFDDLDKVLEELKRKEKTNG